MVNFVNIMLSEGLSMAFPPKRIGVVGGQIPNTSTLQSSYSPVYLGKILQFKEYLRGVKMGYHLGQKFIR